MRRRRLLGVVAGGISVTAAGCIDEEDLESVLDDDEDDSAPDEPRENDSPGGGDLNAIEAFVDAAIRHLESTIALFDDVMAGDETDEWELEAAASEAQTVRDEYGAALPDEDDITGESFEIHDDAPSVDGDDILDQLDALEQRLLDISQPADAGFEDLSAGNEPGPETVDAMESFQNEATETISETRALFEE